MSGGNGPQRLCLQLLTKARLFFLVVQIVKTKTIYSHEASSRTVQETTTTSNCFSAWCFRSATADMQKKMMHMYSNFHTHRSLVLLVNFGIFSNFFIALLSQCSLFSAYKLFISFSYLSCLKYFRYVQFSISVRKVHACFNSFLCRYFSNGSFFRLSWN